MLIQYSVSNYGSIKNEVVFSLIPSKDIEHPENIIVSGKHSANKLAAIYGANASGKSTLFKSMTMAIVLIRTSNLYQIGQPIPVVPFKFCDDAESIPSKFEFIFIAEDGLKYVYGFSATTESVKEEYLYVYKTNKPSMIFDRSEDVFTFSRNEKSVLQPLAKMNTSNKLFLSTATTWNADCTAIPFKWFTEKIDTQTSLDNLAAQALDEYRLHREDNVDFVKKLMQQADINITNVNIETKELSQKEMNRFAFDGLIINNQPVKPTAGYQTKIETGHLIIDANGDEKEFMLQLEEESLGTIQLFYFAPILKKTLENGKVLMIDEIDRSLHPFIVKYLVNLFRNQKINKCGAQLIFTTHDTTLLSLGTFRRDEIYFTEKDAATGITDLYSLDDYAVRKDDNIEKGYLLGRYGAIPYMQTEEIV